MFMGQLWPQDWWCDAAARPYGITRKVLQHKVTQAFNNTQAGGMLVGMGRGRLPAWRLSELTREVATHGQP